MANKLDLTVHTKRYFEVTLPDGEVINISKPSQGLIIDMMAIEQAAKDIDTNKALDMFNDIIVKILNNNKEAKKFTVKYVKDNFDFEIGQIFLTAYMEFVQEVQSNPN